MEGGSYVLVGDHAYGIKIIHRVADHFGGVKWGRLSMYCKP